MKKQLMFLSIAAIIGLSGCGNDTSNENNSNNNKETKNEEMNHSDHSEMNHSSSGELPTGLQEAENPTYKVGSKAIMQSDHMEGMNGAEATIVGAYDTTVYAVSYIPTTGGEKVTNHKWVIHEELKDAGNEPLKAGTEVTLDTDHMEGMKGATAIIDSAEQTTVYMVDYIPTTGGGMVKNHKWVTGNELQATEGEHSGH
jgi:hypothetical protein